MSKRASENVLLCASHTMVWALVVVVVVVVVLYHTDNSVISILQMIPKMYSENVFQKCIPKMYPENVCIQPRKMSSDGYVST